MIDLFMLNRRARVLFLGLLTSLQALATQGPCATLLGSIQRTYEHGWYNFIRNVTADSQTIVESLGHDHPHISTHHLQKLMEFVLENAAAHGSAGAGSATSFEVNQTKNGYIQILVRNPKVSPLPPQLNGVVFTPDSEVVRVPDENRHRAGADRAGGLQGKGLPQSIESLKRLVVKDWPTAGPATMQWREIEYEGAPTIEFELRLPPSTRVLKERKRRDSP